MAVTDLWYRRGDPTLPTKRCGRGLRYRVTVAGYPSKSFRTKKPAEAYEAKLITSGPPTERSDMTVGELLDLWLPTKAGLSKGGRSAIRSGYNHAKRRWADVPVQDVERHDVESWLANLTYERTYRDGNQRVTRTIAASRDLKSKAGAALRGALSIAVARGLLDSNPAAGLELPAQERRDPRFLSLAELGRLARECDGYEAMVWFLGTTALRIGECRTRNVGDVRKVGKRRWRVRVTQTKSRRARDVPIPASVVAMLDLGRAATAPLFTSPQGARINVRNWRRRVFQPAGKRAGLGDLHVHDLRHTAISLAIAAGADVKKVQEMAGHKRASMTLDLYGHLWDTDLDKVAARVDTLIAAG